MQRILVQKTMRFQEGQNFSKPQNLFPVFIWIIFKLLIKEIWGKARLFQAETADEALGANLTAIPFPIQLYFP